MEDKIQEAIDLLRNNGYFVTKIPDDDDLCGEAEFCCRTGYGECLRCNCYVCLLGNK